MRRGVLYSLWLGVVILALLAGFIPEGWAGGGDEKARLLFTDLCSRITSLEARGIESKAQQAVWEETVRYLAERFGKGERKTLSSLPPSALKGKATWSTSTMVGKHIRDIKVTWDRERRKLYIDITGDAGGKELGKDKVPVNKYWEHLEVDVAVEEDEEGYLVLRPQLPKEDEVFISQKGEEVVCKAEGFKGFRGTVRGIWTSAVPAEGSPAFAGLKYKQVQTRRAFTG